MNSTAFVAAPYFSEDNSIVETNIITAQDCAIWLWNNGYSVLCPHTNTKNFHRLTYVPESVYRAFYLKVIRSGLIDLVVFAGNWEYSTGCKEELTLAKTLMIPTWEWKSTYGLHREV